MIGINQDANLYVSEVTPGSSVHIELKEDRQIYLLCIEGDLKVTGEAASKNNLQESLTTRDALEIVGPVSQLSFESPTTSSTNALLLLIEMEKE